jgi:hypothetical protein
LLAVPGTKCPVSEACIAVPSADPGFHR